MSSLPLGHGGQYLCAGNGPKNNHNFVNLHCGGLQQGPGPREGHQEEGHYQQHPPHHDHCHAKVARMATCYFRILFQSVCEMRRRRKETAKRADMDKRQFLDKVLRKS